MPEEQIHGGAFLIARKLFDSELWIEKPAEWKIIWIYILGKVNHCDRGRFKRGEGYFNFKLEQRNIGVDIKYNTIKKFLGYARGCALIGTSRSTRGIIIKVLKYNTYQTLENFKSTSRGTRKAPQKHPDTQELKNDKNVNTMATTSVADETPKFTPMGAEVIKAFIAINPACGRYYKNTTQRAACDRLVEQRGLEQVKKVVALLQKTNRISYLPTITTPLQLEEKWAALEAGLIKERGKQITSGRGLA
jgi:hypothetical protein